MNKHRVPPSRSDLLALDSLQLISPILSGVDGVDEVDDLFLDEHLELWRSSSYSPTKPVDARTSVGTFGPLSMSSRASVPLNENGIILNSSFVAWPDPDVPKKLDLSLIPLLPLGFLGVHSLPDHQFRHSRKPPRMTSITSSIWSRPTQLHPKLQTHRWAIQNSQPPFLPIRLFALHWLGTQQAWIPDDPCFSG